MASVPNRPYDDRILNVGSRSGPPQEPAFAGDDFLAGTTYVTDCNGNTAKNPGKPGFSYDPPEAAQTVVVEADGTVKRYFVHGKETITDYYCRNQGISTSKYDALSDENKKNYCDDPIGGIHYSTSADCGSYVREVSRPLGVDVWNPVSAPPPDPDCKPEGYLLGEVTVTGSSSGSVYGVGPYSINSDVSTAAVHAGLINVGDRAVIAKKSAGPNKISNFPGGTANGVTTSGSSPITGVISKVAIDVAGPLSSSSTSVKPLSVNGSGADIGVQVNSSFLITGVNIFGGGSGYQVGDTFEVISLTTGGSGVTGKLRVSEVKTIPAGAQCGMDLELVGLTAGDPQPRCDQEGNLEDKELIIGGGSTTLGIPTSVSVVNPNVKPGEGINSSSSSSDDWNWYEGCPPQTTGRPSGWPRDYGCGYGVFYVGGPSADSGADKGTITWGINISVYEEPAGQNWNENGCKAPIDSNPGTPVNNIRWKVNSTELKPTYAAWNPQPGHAIGDIWEFRSLGCINKVPDLGGRAVCEVNNDPPYNNPNCSSSVNDVRARFRIDAIEASTTNAPTKLEYTVENKVRIVYTGSYGANFTGDNNIFYYAHTVGDDNVLNASVEVVLDKFRNDLKRPPRETEFIKYVRLAYADGGIISGTVSAQIRNDFSLEYQYLSNGGPPPTLYSCNGAGDPGPSPSPGPGPAPSPGPGPGPAPTPPSPPPPGPKAKGECVDDRNTFYRGTGGTSNGEVDLNELWEFFGSPRNNTDPTCPRPENDSGLTQDNEPDMSDFAGLTLQKWKPCTDGSNNGNNDLGSYDTIIVPCNGPPLERDSLAIYNVNAKITYNDGFEFVGNFVNTPLTPTAEAINNKYLSYMGRNAEQAGLNYWVDQVDVQGVSLADTLRNIEIGAQENGEGPGGFRGGVRSFVILEGDGSLDLSYFIDTRVAPWWGDQELAPPTLTMGKVRENIYMVNVPPTQNEIYFFKAQPTLDANAKKFFQVNGSINFPEITGTPTPGEPAIELKNDVNITWYKRHDNGYLLKLGEWKRLNGGYTLYEGSQMTVSGSASTGTSGNFDTTLTIAEATDGQVNSLNAAKALNFNQVGDWYYCLVEVINRPDNPKAPGTSMPGDFGGVASNSDTAESNQCKFLLNNIDCQDATIGCSGNQSIEVATNEPTTITFSMSINTNCLQYRSGVARISIKREWPCGVFGPADPRRNQWLVEKQTVSIPQTSASSALIQYNLTVPTNKEDYLPGEPGIDVDPGTCHWTYRAYWEIDYPGVNCRENAWSWDAQDCQCGEGLRQLPEIYCSQQQNCDQYPCGPSTGNNPSSPSGQCDGSGWGPGEFDFNTCLPYCWTSAGGCASTFYWCYIEPQPGVNCSGPLDSGGEENYTAGESPFGPGCECPACEQSITVKILDTSECGILGPPNQQEGGGPGPNNAIIDIYSPTEGFIQFIDRQTNPTIMPKDVLVDCNPEYVPGATPDDKCLEIFFTDWVYLPRKTFDTQTTLGNDAAIKIIDYEKAEVDCSETVFTQASWYVKYKYTNGTSSGLQALPIYLGGPDWDPYLRRYNPTAGTNTEAFRYDEEVGNSSRKESLGSIDMIYDPKTIKSVELFLNITSTNDYFGNVLYHPPPAGYFERDFGTNTTVTSPRGAVGATPGVAAQKGTFQVAHFAVADKLDLPEFKTAPSISCPTNPVPYDGIRVTPDIFEFCCGGEIGGCQNTGVSFACQVACESGGCDKQPLSGPKQEISACATNEDGVFSIDWKEIPPAQRKQLKILWFFGRGNGCCIYEGNLSQGDTCSPDINTIQRLARPETTYYLTYYIIASSDGDVSYREINYDDQDPQTGYYARLSWLLTPNINRCEQPYQSTEVKDGERWQTIMGSGTCTIITGKDLDTESIDNPTGSISIVNITNPDGTGPGPSGPGPSGPGPSTSNCYYELCCDPGESAYYLAPCKARRAEIVADGGICCGGQSPTGPLGPISPNPSPSPFNPNVNPF